MRLRRAALERGAPVEPHSPRLAWVRAVRLLARTPSSPPQPSHRKIHCSDRQTPCLLNKYSLFRPLGIGADVIENPPIFAGFSAGVGRFRLNSFIFPVKQGILPERPVRRNCMRHHARRGLPKSGWRTRRAVPRRGPFVRAKAVGIGRRFVGVFALPALHIPLRRGLEPHQRRPKQNDSGDPARAAIMLQCLQHLPSDQRVFRGAARRPPRSRDFIVRAATLGQRV